MLARAVVALALLLVLAGCARDAPAAPGAPSDTPPSTAGRAAADEVRLRLLRSVFGNDARLPDPAEAAPAANTSAILVRYPDRELWLAATTGTGIYGGPLDGAGGRRQVAALYEHRGADWVELARLPLNSTPVETALRQLAGPALRDPLAWVAVTGATAARGGTYEMLRFDGKALTSTFWWFSPLPRAGEERDLDGDGVPEVLLDASDPGVLCAGCGVLDITSVVYRWVGQELTPVQIAPLPGSPVGQPVAQPVARAIALAHAGLWGDAATAMAAARAAAPSSAEVRWMAVVMDEVAAARRAHAGVAAQPLLTEVLAGDYAAAGARMRRLDAAAAFAADGPLIARTAAEGRANGLGAALAHAADGALAVRPELADAYLVRALGAYLQDPRNPAPAIADAARASTLAPGDAFARGALAFLRSRDAR